MNDIELFFGLGWHHIISISALDHILFITALSAIYVFKDWKKVLILITAFTIGHSLTLALSVYDIIRINNKLVEVLIPCYNCNYRYFQFFSKGFYSKKNTAQLFFCLVLRVDTWHGIRKQHSFYVAGGRNYCPSFIKL